MNPFRLRYAVLAWLFYAAGHAQTVTQSFNEPSIGDVDKNYKLDTSAYTSGLPIAVTGSNVVWDFTKVKGAFPVLFDSIVSPSAAQGGSAYPSATYAQKRGSISAFFKSVASPSQTEWVGAWSPSLAITFTNSAIIATYPISYGYSHTDPVTGTFKYNTTNGVCNGSINVAADGIGTLNLPDNVSFQNVLRVRSIETLTMTVGPIPAGAIDQSIYAYYVPGKKYPLITVQYQKYQLLAGTPTITAMAYGNFSYFTVEGISENEALEALRVYPNPAQDRIMVLSDRALTIQKLRLSDIHGRLVRANSDQRDIDVADLPSGVYVLQIQTAAGLAVRKIIRQ